MKNSKLTIKKLGIAALAVFGLLLAGCNSDKMDSVAGPDEGTYQSTPIAALEKSGSGKNAQGTMKFPQFVKEKVTYINRNRGYEEGVLSLPDGSKFRVLRGSLTPPPGTPIGDDVWITMEVDWDATNEDLIFTFGPSGSQFNPSAEIVLDWAALGTTVANLYYIEADGSRILQTPDDVDIVNKKMIIYVDHFSRYAVSAD